MIDHEQVQAAVSARLDGEPSPLDDDVIEAHLAGCETCRRYRDEAVVLSRRLRFVEPADMGMTPPDLSAVIIAGVEPTWRRTAQPRIVGLALSRLLLVLAGVLWVVWGLQVLGDAGTLPAAEEWTSSLLVEGAAFRFSLALGVLTVAWRPGLASGLLTVVAALWTFMFGFLVRDFVLDSVSSGQVLGLLLLLFTLVSMAWAWLSHHGHSVLRAGWRELGSNPV